MTRYAHLLLLASSLLTFAACGGGDDAATGDDAIDAGPDVDAEQTPDADTSCTTDTACVGHNAGDVLCSGSAVVSCAANGDCLDATSTPCNGGDVCVSDGTPACETPVGDGESCATAVAITADTTISGTDFAVDYADDQDFTDASCDDADPATTNAEAVFSVALAAGQRISVTNSGGIDTVMGVQQTCGNTNACVVATDDPDAIAYVADTATTVYVYIGAYEAAPDPADYDVSFDFSSCGDGVVDTDFEDCDDGLAAADNDGCSTTCTYEFGFDCTASDVSPTVCTPFTDLGTFGAGATINYTGAAQALETSKFVTVTFTAPVRLLGTVTATAGDPDVYGYTPSALVYAEEDTGLVETFGTNMVPYFPPGKYVLEVWAYEALTAGFTMALNTTAVTYVDIGTFAPAATIGALTDTNGSVGAESTYFSITFTAPVLLSGSLTAATSGDMDLYWWDGSDLPFLTTVSVGDETITDELLPAGTYHVVTNAYGADGPVDAWTLSLSTTAAP